MRFRLLPLVAAGLISCVRTLTAQEFEPGEIEDNSFLLEEAYNQEAGVVQHVFTFTRPQDGGEREFALTQEWPLGGLRHQISYTVPYVRTVAGEGFGDAEIAYRYQLMQSRVSIAPTLAATVPTGRERVGGGRTGIEGLVPLSLRVNGALAAHSNAGVHLLRGADGGESTTGVTLGQSVIWLAHPRINLLVESLWTRDDTDGEIEESLFVSPGARVRFEVGGAQVVPGLALPIGVGASHGERQVMLYFSVEHAFQKQR